MPLLAQRKKNIDCAALEETLRSRYPEVIWTSIKIYGTKMTVDIQENLLPEENYEEKKEETAHDIVAADDGLITEMITRSGTPVVTVGTPVKKGDVLVNGYVEILNDDGETAQYLYRTADADVIAKVTYSYHDEIPMEYVKSIDWRRKNNLSGQNSGLSDRKSFFFTGGRTI